jgi:hypothetical protein
MRRIHPRDQEIGLHLSYGTYQKRKLNRREADRMRKICAEESNVKAEWGRMHYLRLEQPTTLLAWADAGMAYDGKLNYAYPRFSV